MSRLDRVRPASSNADDLEAARKRIKELEAVVELNDPSGETLAFLHQARRGLLGTLKALERYLNLHGK